MNRPMNDDIHDLAGAYALDAVDDLDRARFEEHLARCQACQRDVDEFRTVGASLAAAQSTPPPASLKAAVMGDVARTRQERVARAVAPRRSRWALASLGAAAAVLVAVLGIRLAAVSADRDDANALAAVLAAPDAKTLPLSGTIGAGRAVYSPTQQRLVVVLDRLPDLAAGRAMQLWYIVDAVAVPGPTFVPSDHRVVAAAAAPPAGTTLLAFTEEPVAGSTSPTGPVLLATEPF